MHATVLAFFLIGPPEEVHVERQNAQCLHMSICSWLGQDSKRGPGATNKRHVETSCVFPDVPCKT